VEHVYYIYMNPCLLLTTYWY